MSKKDTKKTPANKDDSMVEVRVVNNFRDKTNHGKFMASGTTYNTDKKRAAELAKLGYVEYVDEDSDVDDVDLNVDDNSDADTNADDTNVTDNGTPEGNEDDSNTDEDPNANADEDPNADDSNVPNE